MHRIPLVAALLACLFVPACVGTGPGGQWTRADLAYFADDLDDAMDVIVASNAELAQNPYVLGGRALSDTLRAASQGTGEVSVADAIAALEALEPTIRSAIIASGRDPQGADVAIAVAHILLRRIARATTNL